MIAVEMEEIQDKNILGKMTLGDFRTLCKMSDIEEIPEILRSIIDEACWEIRMLLEKEINYPDPYAIDAWFDDNGVFIIKTEYEDECVDVPIIQTDVDDFIEDDVSYEGHYEGEYGPESYNLLLIDIVREYNDELEASMQYDYESAVCIAAERYRDRDCFW